jgi:hypothetical protein
VSALRLGPSVPFRSIADVGEPIQHEDRTCLCGPGVAASAIRPVMEAVLAFGKTQPAVGRPVELRLSVPRARISPAPSGTWRNGEDAMSNRALVDRSTATTGPKLATPGKEGSGSEGGASAVRAP